MSESKIKNMNLQRIKAALAAGKEIKVRLQGGNWDVFCDERPGHVSKILPVKGETYTVRAVVNGGILLEEIRNVHVRNEKKGWHEPAYKPSKFVLV